MCYDESLIGYKYRRAIVLMQGTYNYKLSIVSIKWLFDVTLNSLIQLLEFPIMLYSKRLFTINY